MNRVYGDLSWDDLDNLDNVPGLTNLLKQKKSFTVSVEGNLGCGKSTLLGHFEKFTSSVETLKEPVELWTDIDGHNGLQYIYNDSARWNFSFNYYVLLTRAAMHTKKVKVPVKMLERSLFSTMNVFAENCYRSNTLADVEYVILKEWFDFLVASQDVKVDLFVYLRADPEVCYRRLRLRDRKEEAGVPFEFIDRLHDLHEEWLLGPQSANLSAPVVDFSGTGDTKLNPFIGEVGVRKVTETFPYISRGCRVTRIKVLDANNELPQMKNIYEEYKSQILCGCC